MQKYMMIDIETMGVDFKSDDIIQIGILECIKNDRGFYVPGRSYMRTLFTDQEPKNDWIRTNHVDLLPLCRKTEYASPTEIRAGILSFFNQCGITGPAMTMGLNASVFDIPYLYEKGFIKAAGSGASSTSGDVHYRIYELRGAYNLAEDVLGKDALKRANESCDWIDLPAGKKHEALFDCYAQLKTLNGIIKLFQNNTLASRSAPSPKA